MDESFDVLKSCQLAYRKAGIEQAYSMLGLSDVLGNGRTVEELAIEFNLHPSALSRFLHALCFLGLVEKVNNDQFKHLMFVGYTSEPSELLFWMVNHNVAEHLQDPGFIGENEANLIACADLGLLEFLDNSYFIPSAIQEHFLRESPDYIGPLCQHHQTIMVHFFKPQIIIKALRESSSQWEAAIHKEGVTSAFDAYDDEGLLKTFMTGMHMLTSKENSFLASNVDLSGVGSFLDVGGGSGDWLSKLIMVGDVDCHGFIYELPEAIDLLDSIRKEKTDILTWDRIDYIAGSFLDSADHPGLVGMSDEMRFELISLCWILHDWSDEVCVSILKKIYYHLTSAGKLMILEAVLPEDRIGPACIHDITMLLQTEGRERTMSDYKNLLTQAGFFDVDITRIETETQRQMIVAVKR